MSKNTIFYKKNCNYCLRAKLLLEKLGIPFQEINLEENPDIHDEIIKKTGKTSVPQIWINENYIGGYDDLYQLHQEGNLERTYEG